MRSQKRQKKRLCHRGPSAASLRSAATKEQHRAPQPRLWSYGAAPSAPSPRRRPRSPSGIGRGRRRGDGATGARGSLLLSISEPRSPVCFAASASPHPKAGDVDAAKHTGRPRGALLRRQSTPLRSVDNHAKHVRSRWQTTVRMTRTPVFSAERDHGGTTGTLSRRAVAARRQGVSNRVRADSTPTRRAGGPRAGPRRG